MTNMPNNGDKNFYVVVYDDGDHSVELEQFPTHNEAIAHMFKEIEEWENGTGWDETKKANGEDFSIQIEVIEKDEADDSVYEPLEGWDSEDGWLDLSDENIEALKARVNS